SIARQDQAIVVEGYFDAIALHQAGITNVVASMGTALTAEQVTALLRYSESKRLILNFDADRAGIQAAERAIAPIADQARRGEVELRLLTIPRGKDADEFLRDHGSEEFRALVEQAPLWLDWQIEQILAAKDLSQANQFQQALQSLTRLLSGLGGHWRTLYIHRVAERLSRGNSRLARDLEEELRKSIRQQRWSRPTSRSHPEKGSKLIQSEFHLLQIFLHFGEYRSLIREELLNRDLQFSYTPHRQLWQGISELVQQQPHLEADTEALLVTLRTFFAQDEALNQRLTHLLWLDETSRIALMRPRMVVRAAIATMELEIRQKRYRYWTQLWDQAYQHRQTEQALYFQAKIQSEYRRIQALQKECQMSAEDLQTSLFNVDEL
ncbi:MAG: toprim domain-containing protein, partial [Thermostichales cyanobacterium BF4_bins_65]